MISNSRFMVMAWEDKDLFPCSTGHVLMSREWVIPLLFLVLSCWQASRLFVLVEGSFEGMKSNVSKGKMMIVGAGSGVLRIGSPENLEMVCLMWPSQEKWVWGLMLFLSSILVHCSRRASLLHLSVFPLFKTEAETVGSFALRVWLHLCSRLKLGVCCI